MLLLLNNIFEYFVKEYLQDSDPLHDIAKQNCWNTKIIKLFFLKKKEKDRLRLLKWIMYEIGTNVIA